MVVYHCNGITWDEAWGMSPKHRTSIISYHNELIEEQNAQLTGQRQM